MKTLTLEHLSAYLPYGLIGQLKQFPNGTYVKLGTYLSNSERKWTIDMFVESSVLPILYPLSSLTEFKNEIIMEWGGGLSEKAKENWLTHKLT
jgi:hypothetical protein